MKNLKIISLLVLANIASAKTYIVKVNSPSEAVLKNVTILKNLGPNNIYTLIDADSANFKILSNHPEVDWIEENKAIQVDLEKPIKGLTKSLWWQDDLKLNELWSNSNNLDAPIVAILDTGVDLSHSDLKENIWINNDEIPGNGIDDDQNGYIDDIHGYDLFNQNSMPMDDNGHGTHCAGVISANGTFKGISPNTKIMAVKFLGHYGQGDTALAVEAFTYAINNGATILSNSWGTPNPSNALSEVIDWAQTKGVIVVAAAGNAKNNNDKRSEFPANYHQKNVISVAAKSQSNSKANFSNFGSLSVDIFAPGVNIYSTYKSNSHETLSGTSMATPMVAGVLSYLMSEGLTSKEAIKRIQTSSTKRGTYFNFSNWSGDLNPRDGQLDIENEVTFPVSQNSFKSEEISLETPHPYTGNSNLLLTVEQKGASYIRPYIKKLRVENSYDYVKVYDENMKLLHEFTGNFENVYLPAIKGEKVKFLLQSDTSNHEYGLSVDKIQYQ